MPQVKAEIEIRPSPFGLQDSVVEIERPDGSLFTQTFTRLKDGSKKVREEIKGGILERTTFNYGVSNDLISKTTESLDPKTRKRSVQEKEEYDYINVVDNAGKVKWSDRKLKSIITEKYGADGEVISYKEIKFYPESGNLIQEAEFKLLKSRHKISINKDYDPTTGKKVRDKLLRRDGENIAVLEVTENYDQKTGGKISRKEEKTDPATGDRKVIEIKYYPDTKGKSLQTQKDYIKTNKGNSQSGLLVFSSESIWNENGDCISGKTSQFDRRTGELVLRMTDEFVENIQTRTMEKFEEGIKVSHDKIIKTKDGILIFKSEDSFDPKSKVKKRFVLIPDKNNGNFEPESQGAIDQALESVTSS